VEDGRILRVGPRSAGADPGPAAYGRGGTEATVTDANVVLGRLRPDAFLGGRMALDPERARHAVRTRVAEPLGLGLEEAALGILAVTVHNMVDAIETNSVRKGYDPREFVLVAAGGAGPLVAADIAATMGIPDVLVPPHPGVTAAAGLLASDVRHEVAATGWQELAALDHAGLAARFAELEAQVLARLAAAGFGAERAALERFADCRYAGQGYELRVPAPSGAIDEAWAGAVRDAFEERHEREYFGRFAELSVQVVNVRVTGIGRMPDIRWPRLEAGGPPAGSLAHEAVFAGPDGPRRLPTRVVQRADLAAGAELAGPAIVEQVDSTTVVPPGTTARVDATGNVVLRVGEEAR
jgi:N-methylhydantoinase A/oxoprolinase/acetone carboxylase beta subunit